MKKLLCTVALVGMVVAVPGSVQAQLSAGPLAAFHDDLDFGIGGFLSVPVPSLDPNLSIVPSFVYYFPEGVDAFEINGDVMYAFEVSPDTPVLPFAFAGLNIMRISVGSASNTEMGLNLGGGITFRSESVEPFAGAKFEMGDLDGFVIFGGVGFPLG
jgi:hypothetical protein